MNSRPRHFVFLLSPTAAWPLTLALLCLLAGVAQHASAQENRPREGGPRGARAESSPADTISGRVVADDGRPLADAAINIYRPYGRVPGPPLAASSDAEGNFHLSDLPPGLYVVGAALPGYASLRDLMTDFLEGRFYRPGDFVNITLVKGGVITGTVRDANGEAMVAIAVRAVRVRTESRGRANARSSGFHPERMTDDRGVYRIYGLPPGTYVVSVGGGQRLYGFLTSYEGIAPTYYPSSTRDTATEVVVRGGEEATGIDIRYRGERGHAVSGTVSGSIAADTRYDISVTLRQTVNGGHEAATAAAGQGFSFVGVPDGEYELVAQQWGGEGAGAASLPRRVTVKGTDVTGVALALAPLGSIAGRVHLAAAPQEKCAGARSASLLEIAVNVRRDRQGQAAASSGPPLFGVGGSAPTEQGDFTMRNLPAGAYRLMVRLPTEAWYVREVVLPGARPATAGAKGATPPVITLKAGERLAGATVELAQDAALLRGHVRAAAAGATLPAHLKVHLVPAERERADDVWRYGEAAPGGDGAFSLTNLAPGRYRLVALPAPEDEATGTRPVAWDASARAKLRRAAEAAGTMIELRPCQRVTDYELRFGPRTVQP